MKAYFTASEIAAAQGVSVRAVNKAASKGRWQLQGEKARRREGREGGGGWEYHISLLPGATQAKLSLVHGAPANTDTPAEPDGPAQRWAAFARLSKARKAACEERLKAVAKVASLIDGSGLSETAAINTVARRMKVSARSLRNWRSKVESVERADWLPALADNYRATSSFKPCHKQAWSVLKSDYLRPEAPAFSACYRRMKEAAAEHGWTPIPDEQSLRRRLEAEVPEPVRITARKRSETVKTLYPAQRRDRSSLHAMEAVNIDGHKFDVFVNLPGEQKPTRIMMVALQDLYSGKVVAWRLSASENKNTVRLAIGDMVSRYGIPEKIVLDNGRAFASKWISGGAKTRFRFKVRDEDPNGLLTALGIAIVWATPYSGQSKPIERAFRDLAENIARHPFCSGAYTGNTPDAKPENYATRAIPMAEFSAHVDRMIAEHNARPGRRGGNADGRSFDETFTASMQAETTLVRWPSEAQRALWLLAAERIRTKKGSGEIEIFGNRYWSRELNAHAGREVTVRFDPDRLTSPIHVYEAKAERLICVADCIADTGFFDADAARQHAAKRNALTRTLKESVRLHAELTPDALADIYGAGKAVPEPSPEPPRIKRIAAAGGAAPTPTREAWDEDDEAAFSRAMQRLEGEIIEFPGKGESGR